MAMQIKWKCRLFKSVFFYFLLGGPFKCVNALKFLMGLVMACHKHCFYWVEDDFLLVNFVMRKTHVLGTKNCCLRLSDYKNHIIRI